MGKGISDELNRQDGNDVEKLKLYQHTLNKFLINHQIVENDLSEPIKVKVAKPKPKCVEQILLESQTTKADKKRAESIISNIKAYTQLSWDEKGQLMHQGSIIEESSLSELVSHELKSQKGKRKIQESTGWETYST